MISISAVVTFKTILILEWKLMLIHFRYLSKRISVALVFLNFQPPHEQQQQQKIEHTNLQGRQKRKDCQTETPIDLCKLKIGVVQRVLTTKLGQSRDLATANYSRHIVLQATQIHTTCILATKPSMLSITIFFHVLKEKLVNFLLINNLFALIQHFLYIVYEIDVIHRKYEMDIDSTIFVH